MAYRRPIYSAYSPIGLSGPAGTTAGSGLPAAAYSACILAVGVQVGPAFLRSTLVVQLIGVSLPNWPMPIGRTITVLVPFG